MPGDEPGTAGPMADVTEIPPTVPHAVADVSATVLPEATQEEKVNAIRTLGIDVDNSWLILRDRDFVFKIFDNAKGPLVKDGALQAYRDGDAACTVFIRTGVYDLDRRDKDNQARAEIERDLAHKLKQSAASLISMPVTDQQLDLSYRDFIYEIWRFSAGLPRVKAAALDAFNGSFEDQKAFLDNGLLTAKQQDQQDSIDADKKASEAERARLAARNAKANAASVVLLPVDDALLNLSDDNFIRKVTDKAVQGSEVYAAAWMALRSTVPADWAAFITTGIYEANKRDIDIARRKKADEDRRVTTELKIKAENGLMQPRLVAAAAAALAGSDEDVAAFLQEGQHAVLMQSLQTTTPGVKGWYVRSTGGNTWITPGNTGTDGTAVLDAANWKVVAGLADQNCFSLESSQFPGSYLRQNNFRVQLAANDGSTVFKNDATWCPRPGLNGSDVSLESKALPGRFMRHARQELRAADNSGQNWFDTDLAFEEDSTWRIVDPDPEISTLITLRWYNDDAFRAAVGNPKTAEVYDDGVRYRDYERGRVYWSHDTDVHFVSGDILTKYLSLGGGKSTLPITDTSSTSDGIGQYNHFAPDDPTIGGISIFWSPSTGAHLVHGLIRARWEQLGRETSYLGYPTSDESAISGGRRSTFQHGNIDYDLATGEITDYRV